MFFFSLFVDGCVEVVKKRRQVAATTTTTDGSTSSIDSTLQHQPHPESGDNNVGTTVRMKTNVTNAFRFIGHLMQQQQQPNN